MYHRQGNTTCHHPRLAMMQNPPGSKHGTMVERYYCVPRKWLVIFPEPLRAHQNSSRRCMGLLTDFKKKMQQTELHSSHLIQVEVPVNSLHLKQNKAQQKRVRKYTNTIKRGRPYHKTIAIICAPRLLQIGDDQWPHADEVGYNINKIRHTQVVGQDGLFSEWGERTSNQVSQHTLADL